MSADLLVTGGRLVGADQSREADLFIRNGRIEAVGDGLADRVDDVRVVDARGLLVMPGGIDTHVHMAHPIDRMKIETADDFHTGTRAAAAGGVTTIIDFALQRKGDDLPRVMEDRLAVADADAVVDYGLHMIVTDVRDDVVDQMPQLIAGGSPSFKIYMTYADKMVPDPDLMRVLETSAEHGGIVYLHCENDCAVTHLIERFLQAGQTGPAFHARSRPPQVEAEATTRALLMAEVVGAPVCIAHVTSREAVDAVRRARRRGVPVAAETCPQYLSLTAERYTDANGFEAAKFVCSPPLRPGGHPEALWSGLMDGTLQQVASDHAPFRFADQKTQGREDFTQIPNGLPGVETRMCILFSEGVSQGRISENRFVELTSTHPARIFGLAEKGSLDVGKDGDLVLFDPKADWILDADDLNSAVDYNPFQGMEGVGVPVMTVSRGEIIAENGVPTAPRGRGRAARRTTIDGDRLP